VKRFMLSFQKFMLGRYGSDRLSRHLIFSAVVISLVNVFLKSFFLYFLILCFCFLVYYRMFSKKCSKREHENATYERVLHGFSFGIRHVEVRFRERKTSRFFRCPHCSAPIKMPRKVGKFEIRCGKCQQSFVKEFKK